MILDDVDPEDARTTAEEILRRPEFAERQPSLRERIIDWFVDHVNDLLSKLVPGGDGILIGWIVLVLALALVGWLVWRFAPRRRLRRTGTDPTWSTELSAGRSRRDWLAEAERAEADGAWGRAVHARWHALVAGLAERRQLADDPAATSGEHRRRFGAEADGDRGRRFAAATTRFEDVWFGGQRADEADRDALVEADRELVETDRRPG